MVDVLHQITDAVRSTLSQTDHSGRRRGVKQIEAILRIYVVLGVLIALFSLAFFGLTFVKITLSEPQQISLMMAGLGAMLSMMSFALLLIRRQQLLVRVDEENLASEQYQAVSINPSNFDALSFEVVRQWSRFEYLGKMILDKKNEKYNHFSPRAIFEALTNDGLVSSEELRDLQVALEVRNRIVHGGESVTVTVVEVALSILKRINGVLERLLTANESTRLRRPIILEEEIDLSQ